MDVIFRDVPRLPRWPKHAEFTGENLVLVERHPIVTLGGNGANAAFVAACRGAKVQLYSPVGRDDLGLMASAWLREAGCTVYSPRRPVATACNVTAAHASQRRATYFFSGTPPGFPRLAAEKGAAVLVCGWPHPPLQQVAREFRRLRRAGMTTALDLGPILGAAWKWRDLVPVLAETTLLLGNEHEIRALARRPSLQPAVARFREVCPGDIVVKLGAAGALWSAAGHTNAMRVAAPRIRAINTVGAGDVFNGALLAAFLHGEPMVHAIEQATAVASQIVASSSGVLAALRLQVKRPRRRQNKNAS